MQTYLLSDEDIRRYGLDLLSRWRALQANAPIQWLSLGMSGDKMARALYALLTPQEQLRIEFRRLQYNRADKALVILDNEILPDFRKDKRVFLIDSAVHSGGTMRTVTEKLAAAGAAVMSYTLVLKRTSEFVPSLFSLMIDEHDRALFQLDELPNNRLKRVDPFGHLRMIQAEDVHRPMNLNTDVASIQKISYGDLYYDAVAHRGLVYLYEQEGEIRGYIHFTRSNGILEIDTILADENHRGTGIGGAMMRWAETYARSNACASIDLWSIDSQRSFYDKYFFELVDGKPLDLGDGEVYYRMTKRVLYNIKPGKELLD